MRIRGTVRLILGNKDDQLRIEGEGQVLTSRDVSSLVIDNSCHRRFEVYFFLSVDVRAVQNDTPPLSQVRLFLFFKYRPGS